MASRKTYLYGLGTGLIAGALLLQLATVGELSQGTMTVEQLEAAAAAKGFVLMDAKETWFTREELESSVSEAEARGRTEAAKEKPAGEGAAGTIYAFTIGSGTELTTVAKLLYDLGMIRDYNGFLIEMEERKLTGKVQAKHYRFDTIPSQDELIKALTSP